MTRAEQLAAAKAEYRKLIGSWEYAYAMGHGCSMGMQPGALVIRDRVDMLQRKIRVMESKRMAVTWDDRSRN